MPSRPVSRVDGLAVAFVLSRTSSETDSSTVVFDLVEQEALHTDQADRQFRSASLVRLLIGLDLVERRVVSPKRPSPRMARMLSHSDDEIAGELRSSGGGQQIVTRVAAKIGLSNTEPLATPGRWGHMLITANDLVKVHQHVLARPAGKRALLLDPLRDVARTAAEAPTSTSASPAGCPPVSSGRSDKPGPPGAAASTRTPAASSAAGTATWFWCPRSPGGLFAAEGGTASPPWWRSRPRCWTEPLGVRGWRLVLLNVLPRIGTRGRSGFLRRGFAGSA
ncbi:hypothetical protein [Saccharopolyspora hattusasensis]|uniref:hypothetical protein n=1 Tax=Saccharopolyspora hattusasensis TaxID=1128679 RepID=UPI003D97C140